MEGHLGLGAGRGQMDDVPPTAVLVERLQAEYHAPLPLRSSRRQRRFVTEHPYSRSSFIEIPNSIRAERGETAKSIYVGMTA